MSTSTIRLFVDTNLFLQCHPLEQLDWTPWDGFEEVHLIVSRPVQREIDYRKNKGSDRLASRARATSAMFREMLTEGQKVIRDAGPRVILSVEPEHSYSRNLENRLDYQEKDDQLVGTLHEFARCHKGADVRLLTHDTTPLYTARSLGLTADIIPESWLLPPESTDTEKEILSLRSEIARLKKTEPSFSIRCVGQSNTDLDRYHASFTWFEPLTDGQVDELMQRLKDRFPLESNVGSREPTERAAKRQTVLDILIGNTKENYTPATDEEIEKYREEAHPKWLNRCEEILRNHHRVLRRRSSLPEFSFLAENVGTRPANDALITIEAEGHFQIQPPPPDDEDEELNGEGNETPGTNAEKLPRPPVAPRGQWRRMIGGQPGDVFRAVDALRHSLDEFPHIGHATASGHEFSLPALHLPLPSHDHNAFYYKPSRPSSPRSSFSLSCDQWRHDNEQEPFDGQIHVPVDRDKAEGALLLRIQASNLSKPASKRIPVRITITHVSAFESALSMVEKLLEDPNSGSTADPVQVGL